MNFSNSNLSFPKLKDVPSYGDAMRYHSENFGDNSSSSSSLGINRYGGDEFEAYLSKGEIKVVVDWGPSQPDLYKMMVPRSSYHDHNDISRDDITDKVRLCIRIDVNGIGRRPAMKLLASNKSELCVMTKNDNVDYESYCRFPHVEISWRHDRTRGHKMCENRG
eukprot:CAMPEP_0181103922 /NCGR_PEP_ID=MMETSP1071-20121207/15143_1 /TAXON_ID=35127 /ORGANISM="Thalassiosira sp., Strain NH16" /LENGTH=163 /DNA_ID=CAMNT_0023187067 /DNA_START=153 /DNA_END=641 /DNA_ORIENTATION=-